MSVASSVFLMRSAMPTPKRWAAAIREAGFALKLDEDFDVETFSGFLPCEYEGVAAGLEYSFGEADTSQLSEEQRASSVVATSRSPSSRTVVCGISSARSPREACSLRSPAECTGTRKQEKSATALTRSSSRTVKWGASQMT